MCLLPAVLKGVYHYWTVVCFVFQGLKQMKVCVRARVRGCKPKEKTAVLVVPPILTTHTHVDGSKRCTVYVPYAGSVKAIKGE